MDEFQVPERGQEPGSVTRLVIRHRGAEVSGVEDHIAEEVPVALIFNDTPFAVMMATPADLEDFALGFAHSEGIVERIDDAQVQRVEQHLEGVEVHIAIPAEREQILQERRRSMSGRSGCGVCGSESLEAALRTPAPVGAGVAITVQALQRALRELRGRQRLNALTGATHAAGWALADGQMLLVREDVGRHNALDKLIGAMHRAGLDPQAGLLVVSSRASYEMAMKAASAGIAFMAAISAPTALAVSLAQRAGLTLLGFAREDGHAIYTHPQRLIQDGASER